jgi:hypothetical protein
MGENKVDQNSLIYIVGVPLVGWLTKEVVELRSIKTDVPHIRERVDKLYDYLIGEAKK